jgi:xanthine dehydrogenase YagR molybdenum-binding subunit
VGNGVAASVYPAFRLPGSAPTIRVGPDGRYTVLIGAADIGTGTWTTLAQIAANALEVAIEHVDLRIGDTSLPMASGAGGSSGIISWGTAIVEAATQLRARLQADHGKVPEQGVEVTADMPANPYTKQRSMYSSVRSLPRCVCARRLVKCVCRACLGCSTPGGSSTRRPPARNSSEA